MRGASLHWLVISLGPGFALGKEGEKNRRGRKKISANEASPELPRTQTSLSMCAQRKAGRRQRARRRFACRLYPSHGPLRFITSHSFRARLCHAKNEAPEEEAEPRGSVETGKGGGRPFSLPRPPLGSFRSPIFFLFDQI